ncbi:FAD-binding oxidoreductase [Micromonospora sp. NBC_01699]|uniref:NAD(P)/FAD-dependent oxidoreductase n=1 Tax=Micromonospora sp. NBC_01699 TaxID=2975984 RepID=UPI002E30091E|nr:FAD-binding oxidoreductase [Micromonospora sp. NBC_01699]
MTGPASTPWHAAPADRESERLTGQVSADVVIVGAGLVGLSTALHLLDRSPGSDVLVVDAAHPAAGASGHGTGLLGPRVGPPVDKARRRYGDPTARLMHEVSTRAVTRTLDLISELDIECGLRTGAQAVVARDPATARALVRRGRSYLELGLDVPALSAQRLDEIVRPGYRAGSGTRPDGSALRWRTGLAYRPAATLDPAALTRGLAAAATRAGARLHGDSRVLRVLPDRHAVRLELPGAVIRAGRVLVAVNGYADLLELPAAVNTGTLLPLQVHAVATAPLSEPVLDDWAVIEAGELAPYFRMTADRRLVVGGGRAVLTRGAGVDTGQQERAWRFLTGWLRALHPRLRETPVEHRWSGRISLTADGLPVVGRVADRIWFAGGCCGHGLAMGVATGAYLAERLGGASDESAGLPWHRSRAPWLPLRGPARPLLRAYLAVLAARAEVRPARAGATARSGAGTDGTTREGSPTRARNSRGRGGTHG